MATVPSALPDQLLLLHCSHFNYFITNVYNLPLLTIIQDNKLFSKLYYLFSEAIYWISFLNFIKEVILLSYSSRQVLSEWEHMAIPLIWFLGMEHSHDVFELTMQVFTVSSLQPKLELTLHISFS